MIRAGIFDAGIIGLAGVYGHLCQHVLVDLDRRLEPAHVRRAVEGAVADFPVLGCRYQTRWWRDRWVPLADPANLEVVDQVADDVAAEVRRWVRAALGAQS